MRNKNTKNLYIKKGAINYYSDMYPALGQQIRFATSRLTLHRLLIAVVFSVLAVCCAAQGAVVYSSISQRELSVGDRVYFTVTIMAPSGATVMPPDPSSAFGSVVVKEWNSRKFSRTKADSLAFEYVLTTYKAENCTIPALSFVLAAGAATDTLRTDSIPLKVVPLCTSDSADICGLKPQQTAGKRPLLWLWLCIAAAAIIAGAFTARSLIQKMKKPPPPPPPKPPYDEAIEALAALEAKQYLIAGKIRDHVFELSDILKRYVERRFGVNAAEFTTEEMLAWLGVSPLDKEQRLSLEWFFRAADPVKFAKMVPDGGTVDRFGVEVRGFLEATKPRPAEAASTVTAPQKNGASA